MNNPGTLLNKYLQPLGSPVDNSNSQIKYVPWQWGIQQGISTRKIRSSSAQFKKFSPGTITGGTLVNTQINNGTVNDSALSGGTQSGSLSGQGTIAIGGTSGAITNSGGTNIIDSTGLNSLNNFGIIGTTSIFNARNTANTSFVALANTSLTVILKRTQNILIGGGGNFQPSAIIGGQLTNIYVGFDIDGTVYPDSNYGFGAVNTSYSNNGTSSYEQVGGMFQHVLAVGGGTHTIQMKWMVSAGGGTASCNNTYFNIISLGN